MLCCVLSACIVVHYVVSRVGSYWSLDDEMNEEDEVYLRTVMALSFLGDAVVAAAGDRKRRKRLGLWRRSRVHAQARSRKMLAAASHRASLLVPATPSSM